MQTRVEAWERYVQRGGPAECWGWGAALVKGYGFLHAEGRAWLAHRVSFEVAHGSVPQGVVRHACDTTWCQNPAHLLDGTQLQNCEDRDSRGRGARGEKSGSAKLTDSIVSACRREHRAGVSKRQLSRRYGVDVATMIRAIRGDTWTHVSEPPVISPSVRSTPDLLAEVAHLRAFIAEVRSYDCGLPMWDDPEYADIAADADAFHAERWGTT